MKKGKEVTLKLNKNFKTYYGTIDNKELKSLYVGLSTWLTPLEDIEDYSKSISKLRRTIKNCVSQNINPQLFKLKQHIVDVDIKESRMIFNKTSYLFIEVTLFTNSKLDSILTNTIKMDMVRFINSILNTIEESDNFNFNIKKTKNVSII